MSKVLIVDDDAAFSLATAQVLEKQGFAVITAFNLDEARQRLAGLAPAILLLDVRLPDGSGLELIQQVNPEETRIVVMTAHPTVDIAVDSLRARVADFLVKPVEPRQLIATLETIRRALARSVPIVPASGLLPTFAGFVGNSPPMLEIYKMIERVAPSRASVLIRGESGTGKELVAEAIHVRSERRDKRFLSLNCGAISAELIGSELFGHERGSFTGATRQHQGYFERTDGGTLFLDEITEMPQELQVQLLRVLETDKLVRIGGFQELMIDVRIIAATNRDPQEAIREGRLREDLYFRLAVFPIWLPPLNERAGDIPLLADFFLEQLNRQAKMYKRFAPSTLDWLDQQHWPGNVRELKNAVQRAFILAEEEISQAHFLDQPLAASQAAKVRLAGGDLSFTVGATPMEEAERQLILATLEHYKGNKPKAAEALGISLKTLYNRLKQYGQEG